MKKIYFTLALLLTICVNTLIAQQRLQLIGDATRYGWNKDHGSPVTLNTTDPSVFHFNAWLNSGSFKINLSNADWVPSWGPGEGGALIKRATYEDTDLSFTITSGNYHIVIDTTKLTYSITPINETTPIPFNTLFMVGSAAPDGWDLGKAAELTRNPENPWEFGYKGVLNEGELKFPVNRYFGWSQDMFMRETDTKMFLGTSPDSKWAIAETGNYAITLNVASLSISIQKDNTTGLNVQSGSGIVLLNSQAKSELVVESDKSFDYTIYSPTGSTMLCGKCDNARIQVSSLPQGIYLLQTPNQVFRFLKE